MQNQPSNSIHEHIVAQPHLFNYLTQKKSAVLKLDANRNILKVNIFCGLDALTYWDSIITTHVLSIHVKLD